MQYCCVDSLGELARLALEFGWSLLFRLSPYSLRNPEQSIPIEWARELCVDFKQLRFYKSNLQV